MLNEQQIASTSSSGDGSLTDYALSFVAKVSQADGAQDVIEKVYGFKIGGKDFLLPLGTRAEIIPNPDYTPLPNAPSHCLGLVNVRGAIAPLYSLAPFLARDHALTQRSQNDYGLLLGDPTEPVMIVVDGKPNAVDLDQMQEVQVSRIDFTLRTFVTRVFQDGGNSLLMLDCNKLFQFLASSDGH